MVPHPTVIYDHIRKEAKQRREEIAPLIRKVIKGGKAAGTTDLWTCKYTHDHFFAFTLHFIREDFVSKIVILLTIEYEGKETSDGIKAQLIAALKAKYGDERIGC